MTTEMRRLRIDSVPPGEAPLWVREQWVELELPLAQPAIDPVRIHTAGVLSGPRTFLARVLARLLGRTTRESGFLVDAVSAVGVLDQSSAAAAAWWRQHAAHMVQPGRTFLFHEGCCRVVTGSVNPAD